MKFSNLQKAIVILPFLGVEDVLSTLFVEYSGYSLQVHESGSLARYFIDMGLFYLAIPLYLAILSFMALAMLHIRDSLKSSLLLDKAVFLLLVGTVCFMDAFLSSVVVSNLLFGLGKHLTVNMEGVRILTGISVGFAVLAYAKNEIAEFLGS
ncbi:MAG: hypothetical protein QXE76_04720 [Candidatus Bathyarchaeia archaeon]